MVDFPDHSSQEEIIRVVGDAELLYKRGVKTFRYKKSWWGCEDCRCKYELTKPYLSGRVLHLGLGMGLCAEEILKVEEVTELICYEELENVCDLFELEFEGDERLTVVNEDAHEDKPSGTFDVIFYELPDNSQAEYDKSEEYLTWAWDKINSGGYLIVPYSIYSVSLIGEFPSMQPVTLSSQYKSEGVKISLKPQALWLVVQKG